VGELTEALGSVTGRNRVFADGWKRKALGAVDAVGGRRRYGRSQLTRSGRHLISRQAPNGLALVEPRCRRLRPVRAPLLAILGALEEALEAAPCVNPRIALPRRVSHVTNPLDRPVWASLTRNMPPL